jgi:hypothetical protein
MLDPSPPLALRIAREAEPTGAERRRPTVPVLLASKECKAGRFAYSATDMPSGHALLTPATPDS